MHRKQLGGLCRSTCLGSERSRLGSPHFYCGSLEKETIRVDISGTENREANRKLTTLKGSSLSISEIPKP